MIRAITADGAFRAVALRADDMVAEAIRLQEPPGGQGLFGEVLLAAAMIRETMAPEQRVQVSLRSAEGSVMGDSFPGGLTRGMMSGTVPFPGDGTGLHVARVLPEGSLQQGLIESSPEGFSASLNHYMRQSEQITSTVGVSCLFEDGVVKHASGFMVQILPDAEPLSLAAVTEGLETLPDDWPSMQPDLLMASLIGIAGYRILEEPEVYFGCTCSEERVIGALASMGRDEIVDVIAAGETLTVDCEYCRTAYAITPEMLAPLLRK